MGSAKPLSFSQRKVLRCCVTLHLANGGSFQLKTFASRATSLVRRGLLVKFPGPHRRWGVTAAGFAAAH